MKVLSILVFVLIFVKNKEPTDSARLLNQRIEIRNNQISLGKDIGKAYGERLVREIALLL